LAVAALISGCATSHNPADPFEGYNRAMFKFNDKVDQVALKPAATVYKNVLPSFVQTGIGNFFGNLGDIWTAVNNLLQGKLEEGMSDVGRVTINTFAGLGGVIDVASDAGLPKHREDFGQTLGKWGVKPGPYVVLPLLGSSTLRDTVALPVDISADPWVYVYPVNIRNTGIGARALDQRAGVLDASTMIEEASLDKYEFVRDAYLQRRQSLIHENGVKQSGGEEVNPASGDWETVESAPDKLSSNNTVNSSNLVNRDSTSPEATSDAVPAQQQSASQGMSSKTKPD